MNNYNWTCCRILQRSAFWLTGQLVFCMLMCLIVALLNVENESKIFFWVFNFGCIHKVHSKRACTVVYGRFKNGIPHLPSITKHRFKEVLFIGLCQHHKILHFRTNLNKNSGDMLIMGCPRIKISDYLHA